MNDFDKGFMMGMAMMTTLRMKGVNSTDILQLSTKNGSYQQFPAVLI